MFIWIGAATCLYAAFAVGHSGFGAIIVFIFSKNKNLAALSIPYGLVAVWNQSAEGAGHVGSVAMQMAILNCTIKICQQACTLLLGALESLGNTENDSLTQLLIISWCSSMIVAATSSTHTDSKVSGMRWLALCEHYDSELDGGMNGLKRIRQSWRREPADGDQKMEMLGIRIFPTEIDAIRATIQDVGSKQNGSSAKVGKW